MPAKAQYMSSTPGGHGYGGPTAPSLKCARRPELLQTVLHTVAHGGGFKGIRFRPELGRYISEIRPAQPRKRKIWLGTYKTAEEAARAFDAGIFYTKKSITYNFEDSPSILEPLPENLSPEEEHVEIQKKAKAAAARAQPSDPEHDQSQLVSKSHSYVSHPRNPYPHDFNLELAEPFYQRDCIPREIQFAVLNRS